MGRTFDISGGQKGLRFFCFDIRLYWPDITCPKTLPQSGGYGKEK